MKIVSVAFEHFRNIPNKKYDLNGKNIVLMGDNRVGKSNFQKGILLVADAIAAGKDAIASGHNKASIEMVCAQFKDWQQIPGTSYTFRADITKNGEDQKVKITVKAPNGFEETKKTVIGSLVGEISLDFDFVSLSKTAAGKRKQLEIFESYMDEEIRTALAVEKQKIAAFEKDRLEIGRKRDAVAGFIKESGLNPEDFQTYAEPQNIDVLTMSRNAADQHNKLFSWTEENVLKWEKAKTNPGYKSAASMLETWIDAGSQWMKSNPMVDLTIHDERIKQANEHNAKHESVKIFKNKQNELEKLKTEYGEFTALIESGRECIVNTLRDLVYPIDGITFDEDNVYYFGKLIDEDNMSTAEIKILEARLRMLKNPGLEVLFIGSGEQIGEDLLREIQVEANKFEMQVIMEEVKRGQRELQVEFMPTINE